MIDLIAIVDELWRCGVGPDDRPRLDAIVSEARAGRVAPPEAIVGVEFALFFAILDLMAGSPARATRLDAGPATARVLAGAVAVWSAALERDAARLDVELAALEHRLGALAVDDPDPRVAAARIWADLALGEAAIVVGDRSGARQRFESVSRSGAPIPLRIAATLRIVTLLLERGDLEQARARCRQAATLADTGARAMHAQHARITGALLDFVAGDLGTARATLVAAAAAGPLGLLPRILLSAFEPPERAMPLLAQGLQDAGARGDSFAFAICTLVGARGYARIDRDADALLTLATAITTLRAAPALVAMLDAERASLQSRWGDDRYRAAERAAMVILGVIC